MSVFVSVGCLVSRDKKLNKPLQPFRNNQYFKQFPGEFRDLANRSN